MVTLRVETSLSALTGGLVPGELLRIPIKHGEGQFTADAAELQRIEGEGRVVFRYCDAKGEVDDEHNPNGAANAIAGLRNERGNVVGLMPHPEHAVDSDTGPTGGQPLFHSLLERALDQHPAEVQHRDRRAQPADEVDVVLDDDRRDAEFVDQLAH